MYFGRRHHHPEESEHPEGHRHGPEHGHGHPPHHGRGPRGGFGGPGGGPWGGGPGGRAKRGEGRYLLLDALRDGPRHGYEIIKTLEERSSGHYSPSPGMVYPNLQMLEDLGLVRSDQEAERRVYHLTDAGRAELIAHAEEIAAFWGRLAGPAPTAAGSTEIGFLKEEMEQLHRTVWGGLRGGLGQGDAGALRRIRQVVEGCRNEVRRILTEAAGEAR